MKKSILTCTLVGLMATSPVTVAAQHSSANQMVKQQYLSMVNEGKTFRDAYEALAYEIAYETSAVQAKQPCRKLVRGL